MRKIAFVMFLLSWVPVMAGKPASKPVIKVDQAEHDYGLIWTGPDLQHSFKITNTGTTELKINNVRPNCGCTIAGNYPKLLAPGSSGTFPFSLNTTRIKGTFNKSIIIASNDPEKPEIKLSLKGEGRPLVAFEPANANFGSVYGTHFRTRVLAIENNGDTPLKLSVAPGSAGDKFRCKLEEKVPGQSFELAVTFSPAGLKPGLIEQNLHIMTNSKHVPQVMVNALAALKDRIDIEPRKLVIGAGTSQPTKAHRVNNPIARKIRVRNYGEKPIKVIAATVNDPELSVTFREETIGRLYSIEVSMPANYVLPPTGRMITVKTDDLEKSELEIPIQRSQPAIVQNRPNPAEKIGKESPAFSLTNLSGRYNQLLWIA